jgi:predicted Zn-dependent protease
MKDLSPADQRCLRAAEGWFGLGCTGDAEVELQGLSPDAAGHPATLELRWRILAKSNQWDACLEIAQAITTAAPRLPSGWIHLSYALHELKRTQEAWDNLLAVVGRFPEEPAMTYNLACYACRLGRLREARRWYKATLALGRKEATRRLALEDPDLEPLWTEIEAL